MPHLTLRDSSRLFFKDWGSGPPIVFSHGWPLTADAWDTQLMFFASRGYRVIAHDRRGHGRSQQTWHGNTMDTYADDLAELLDQLDVKDAILVGHSTGGGEVTRYIGRHGTKRVARIALVGAIPPRLLQSSENPEGAPRAYFDGIRAALLADRSSFAKELAVPFYGFNRPGAKVSQGLIDSFWLQTMMGGLVGIHDCVTTLSEADFTEDLKRFDVPTLIVHGDDDQVVPINISSLRTAKLVKGAILKVYKGAPHGLAQTMADTFNADLLSFIEAGRAGRRVPAQEGAGAVH